MTAPEDQNGLREALARADPLTDEEMTEIDAADPFRQPPPPPIPVRDRYYLIECEHCGWVGSSEQCGNGGAPDYDDIICAGCHQSICGDGPNEADTAKHGQAVFDRITAADASLRAAEAEITRLKEGMEALGAALKPFAARAPGPAWPDDFVVNLMVRAGDLRAAQSLLAILSPKEHPHG